MKVLTTLCQIQQNHHELMQRVKSLSQGEIIQLRLCKASANTQAFNKDDLDQIVQIMQMADAEIIELQNNGVPI
jgi:intracellular sulfur oxidation DsrE/DsrF family protein